MRPHLVNRMSWLHNRKTQLKIYKGPAAGWGALLSVTHAWLNSEQPIKNIKALLRTNQQGGFDCPGCAWGDSPESGAVKWEATSRRVDAKFCARHSVTQLREQSASAKAASQLIGRYRSVAAS